MVERLKTALSERNLDTHVIIFEDWDRDLEVAEGSTSANIKAAATSLGFQIGRDGAHLVILTKTK